MGMSATENIYYTVKKFPYFGPPGVGLNAGVIMMNLTRMRYMSGGGFTGAVRSSIEIKSYGTAITFFRHVFYKHKFSIKLADQDILNAIFGYSPW